MPAPTDARFDALVIGGGPAGLVGALYLARFRRRVLLIDAIELRGSDAVVTHGAPQTVCDALYCALGMRVHATLATALGARCDRDGYLYADAHQRSSVDGLFVAGDVARGLNQISVAAGGAAVAASAMHRWLGV
jgi:thioredoxin reductase (NADPH)